MYGSGVVVMLQQQQRHRGLCSFATPVRVNISTPFLCCPFNESVLCRLKQYNNTPHDHICLPAFHPQSTTNHTAAYRHISVAHGHTGQDILRLHFNACSTQLHHHQEGHPPSTHYLIVSSLHHLIPHYFTLSCHYAVSFVTRCNRPLPMLLLLLLLLRTKWGRRYLGLFGF